MWTLERMQAWGIMNGFSFPAHDEIRRPFEIFINSKNLEHFQWVVALTRVISAVFRKGGDVTFLVEELKAVFDPHNQLNPGKIATPATVADVRLTGVDEVVLLGGGGGRGGSPQHPPFRAPGPPVVRPRPPCHAGEPAPPCGRGVPRTAPRRCAAARRGGAGIVQSLHTPCRGQWPGPAPADVPSAPRFRPRARRPSRLRPCPLPPTRPTR